LRIFTEIGTDIEDVEVTDADLVQNSKTVFSILPGGNSDKFKIETTNNKGVIRIKEVCFL